MYERGLLREKVSQFRVLTQMYERLFPTCADRMWAVRNALQMSQKEFAEKIGMTNGWVSRIECGYSLPKGTTLEKIVDALGLSADFILGTDGKVNQRIQNQAVRVLEAAEEEMQGRRKSRKAG